jgi:hypothetical protein
VSDRDAVDKDFDPSSVDDVCELVKAWASQGSMTSAEIAHRLRTRGVLAHATSSGRHLIIASPGRPPTTSPEPRLFVMPTTLEHLRHWLERAGGPTAPRLPRVIRPPGQLLHRVAGLFGKRTRERVLEPIIADMQLEYCEALASDRPRTLRLWWVQARAWVAFAEAIFVRTVIGRIIRGLSRLV